MPISFRYDIKLSSLMFSNSFFMFEIFLPISRKWMHLAYISLSCIACQLIFAFEQISTGCGKCDLCLIWIVSLLPFYFVSGTTFPFT